MASEEQLERLKFSRDPAPSGNGRVIAGVVFGFALGIGLAFAVGFGSSDARSSNEAPTNEIDFGQQVVATATAEEAEEDAYSASDVVLEANGYVVPRRKATVSSIVTGVIEELLVDEGMQVEEGQILARLDSRTLRIQAQIARSRLAVARRGYDETVTRLRYAEREQERLEELVRNSLASDADVDAVRVTVEVLVLEVDRFGNEVTVAEQNAQLREEQIEDLVVRAPFGGTVVARNAQVGEVVSATSAGGGFTRTGIFTLVDMDSLEMEADVNELYLDRVHPGQSVQAELYAYPNWQVNAEVISITRTADRNTGTFKLRIGILQKDERILPDMGVKLRFLRTEQ